VKMLYVITLPGGGVTAQVQVQPVIGNVTVALATVAAAGVPTFCNGHLSVWHGGPVRAVKAVFSITYVLERATDEQTATQTMGSAAAFVQFTAVPAAITRS